jgi:aryl-alcohol dehydrogenase-like predicted oxidoreductase
MRYRMLGRTGLRVRALLGTMTFGGKGMFEVIKSSAGLTLTPSSLLDVPA